MVEMRPLISDKGDIQLHGREGLLVTLAFFEDEDGLIPRDMSLATVRFEIEGFSKLLTLGSQTNQMVLTLNQGELPNSIGRVVEFIVVDATGSIPHVVWEGNLVMTGWYA